MTTISKPESSTKSQLTTGDSNISTSLPDRRRKKLLALRRQEHMRGVLVRKFTERYGSASCGQCPQTVIRSEVSAFLKNASISERNLGRLERRIQQLAINKQCDQESSIVSSYSCANTGSRVSKSLTKLTGTGTSSSIIPSGVSKSVSPSSLHIILENGSPRRSKEPSNVEPDVPVNLRSQLEESAGNSAVLPEAKPAVKVMEQVSSRKSYVPACSERLLSKTSMGFSAASESDLDERQKRPKRTQPFCWSALDVFAAWEREQEAKENFLRNQKNKMDLRAELDRQVSETRLKKEKRREEDMRYYRHQVQEMEAMKEVENARTEQRRDMMARDAQAKVTQLKLMEARKKEEMQRDKEEGHLMLQQIKHETELDKQAALEKKKSNAEHVRRMFADNVDEKTRKIEEKQQEYDEEARHLKIYNEMMDKQDQARAEELRVRAEKQKVMESMMESEVFVAHRNLGKELDRRTRKQSEELNAKADRIDREKKDDLRQRRLEIQEYQRQQMAVKADRKNDALKSKEAQRKMVLDDTEDFFRGQAEVVKAGREKNFRNRRALEEQISQKKPASTHMTEQEVELNRDLIERVEQSGALNESRIRDQRFLES